MKDQRKLGPKVNFAEKYAIKEMLALQEQPVNEGQSFAVWLVIVFIVLTAISIIIFEALCKE